MMLASHFRDVSVTTALLVITLMNLIFFTGLLQVTVATDESTPKSASSDDNKHIDNGKLSTLGGMNMALFAKLGSGINETALKIDCNKVPTPKPTVTPTPTSSSKTVIIIVVVVVIVLLIIGGIVVYCCFFAGDKGKKKTGGKQGQKVTGKGGAVSGSKMGSDGKSSSVRGGSKSQVGSKLAADSKVGAGKSVA
ncbi:hypothetical protein TYRP_011025 [Tyrophagus putrescentiae]|nr:hypothetical protein TYRP_011025 [Tyrophagus putrescentiae]